MSSRSQSQSEGRIAVIGDRELALGYRLLGVDDTYIVSESDAVQTVTNVFNSGEFSMIIIADFVRKKLPKLLIEKLESSLIPLVVFMPSLNERDEEESLATLAKRVLGIELKVY